jgi:predicted transposase YdaD
MAEHEIGFAKGKKEGHAEGFAEGKTEGREAGLAEGRAEGFAEGVNEGELKKAREISKGLRDDGVSMEIIVRRSGLSEEEIRKL